MVKEAPGEHAHWPIHCRGLYPISFFLELDNPATVSILWEKAFTLWGWWLGRAEGERESQAGSILSKDPLVGDAWGGGGVGWDARLLKSEIVTWAETHSEKLNQLGHPVFLVCSPSNSVHNSQQASSNKRSTGGREGGAGGGKEVALGFSFWSILSYSHHLQQVFENSCFKTPLLKRP